MGTAIDDDDDDNNALLLDDDADEYEKTAAAAAVSISFSFWDVAFIICDDSSFSSFSLSGS